MNTQFPEIERRAYALAQQAANKGIRLSFDDAFELLIHPDKTWDLICLDLENVDPKSNLPNLAEENIRYTQTFLSALRSVYQIFLERGSTQS